MEQSNDQKTRKDDNMVINSSKVTMASERNYSSYSKKTSASLTTQKDNPVELTISEESKSLLEQLKEFKKSEEKREQEEQKENQQKSFIAVSENPIKTNSSVDLVKSKEDFKYEMVKKILDSLRNHKSSNTNSFKDELKKIQAESKKSSSMMDFQSTTIKMGDGVPIKGAGAQTVWTKTTVESSFFAEHEHTAYQAGGSVKTADGREINFNITLEMSRAFCQKNESFVKEDFILTDPLVINLDTNIASISDQKFLFDINADGKEDDISYLNKGSGFLALDKNDDGIINDGNELFGAKTGDGFKELAEYDQDGNGWIDEADSIFKDLKVWMKNDDGTDQLLTLKEAGVGAIYLGSASTEYSLNNATTNNTNAVIQKTGVYLKENGDVSTIQHVDFAI